MNFRISYWILAFRTHEWYQFCMNPVFRHHKGNDYSNHSIITVRIQTRSLHTDYSGNALFGMLSQMDILSRNDSVWTSLATN